MSRRGRLEDRRRGPWVWIAVLGAVCGLPLMLLMIAVGAGDTAQGNSSSPFVIGDVTIIGVPVVLAVLTYVAMRRSGTSQARAVLTALLIPPAVIVAVAGVFWLLIILL
jgi:hypothetical protein